MGTNRCFSVHGCEIGSEASRHVRYEYELARLATVATVTADWRGPAGPSCNVA